MRFHVGEMMTAVTNLLPLAKAAETFGYYGYSVSDGLLYPKEAATPYSYSEDGSREFLDNKPFLECFVHAAAIGAATTRLEVTTSVIKLPLRHPIHTAKLAASISALTDGRFNLGVGLSVWPEDYRAFEIDYKTRGRRLDDGIAIIRGLTAGGYYEHHSEFYDFPPIKINPLPSGKLPILIGGHSDAALKRAARHDGWSCAGGPPDRVAGLIAKLRRYREVAEHLGDFRIFEADTGYVTYDDARRKQDLGITDLIVTLRNIYAMEEDTEPLARKLERFERFADTVIARMS